MKRVKLTAGAPKWRTPRSLFTVLVLLPFGQEPASDICVARYMELPRQLLTAATCELAARAGRAPGNSEERTGQEEMPLVPSGDTQSHWPMQGAGTAAY